MAHRPVWRQKTKLIYVIFHGKIGVVNGKIILQDIQI